jgi:hypothetical protein
MMALLSPAKGSGIEPCLRENPDFRELADTLAENGSITPDAARGKALSFIGPRPDSVEVPGPPVDRIPRIRASHLFQVLSALLKALYLLRIRGIDAAIKHVKRLRPQAESLGGDDRSVSDAVEIYNRVKPIFSDAKDNCLLNSLSMIIFLANYRLFPRWWFGVSLRPFSAHCWVEDENWLYNDQFSRTYRYTPIMRV